MNVLLSCRCERKFSPPPLPGDILNCPTHGPVTWEPRILILKCEDCDYTKRYSQLAPMALCTDATKHAIRKHHRVFHQTAVDSTDRMCLHDHRKDPVFSNIGPPPF